MTESTPVPPVASTFVVRFWREWSAAEVRWRGQIEHVQSGEKTTFLDMGRMLEFLGRFVAIPEDQTEVALGADET